MDVRSIKPLALCLVLTGLGGVLAWKGATLWTSHREIRKPPAVASLAQGPNAPLGSVLITVNMVGFDPETIPAVAGQPLKLAFYRVNAANCGREVVFPSLGIRKELPPGETVVVDITPQTSGTLHFECGMKMMKGQLIVR